MIRYLCHLLATLALLTSTFAQAQTVQDGFVVPTDVVTLQGGYTESFDGYEAGTTINVLGDGSNDWGGTMPVIAEQPADIPSTASGWKLNSSTTSFIQTIPPASQHKWRGAANGSHVNYDDAIRNSQQPGTSHCHQYFGSTSTNAYSTYASLRTQANNAADDGRAASTIAGGPYNATGYWFPCPVIDNAFGDGKDYVVKVNRVTVYYASSPTTVLNRLPRGLRYVFGTNMDDPLEAGHIAEVAAANATASPSNRYSRGGAGVMKNGFVGYVCRNPVNDAVVTPTAGGTYTPYLKSSVGVDPWGGNCLSGYQITAALNAPPCYDGVNLWSPGGYRHFRNALNDTRAPGADVCPKGWYRVPVLQISIIFDHGGFADYGRWRLSSDDAMQAKVRALALAGDPGYAGKETYVVANGESFHTDWMNGWDDQVMYSSADGTVLGWQKLCLGVEGNTANECNGAQSGTNYHLAGGGGTEPAPDSSRVPQVDYSDYQFDTANAADMYQLPATVNGPHTIHSGVN